jgi:hypothetical protein
MGIQVPSVIANVLDFPAMSKKIVESREWPIFAQTASFCRNLNNHATDEEQ